VLPARRASWNHWHAAEPTPATWYAIERFTDLLATLVRRDEQVGAKPRSIRDFIATFKGLTGTQKPKDVYAAAKLTAKTIADLFPDREADEDQIRWLHRAMIDATKPVEPKKLGVIGKEMFFTGMRDLYGADGENVEKYRIATGTANGLPWVVEVGFAINGDVELDRVVAAGVNWSPSLRVPFEGLIDALGRSRVDDHDPVIVAVHLAYPGASATDRGKSRYDLPDEIHEAMIELIRECCKDWRKLKVRNDRDDARVERHAIDSAKRGAREQKKSVKEIAFKYMEESYRKAAVSGRGPARQIMYANRNLISERAGIAEPWKDSRYFTQTLLPAFIHANPELTADWDVVYDDRGHFQEPHTGHRIRIGTVSGRNYVRSWYTSPPPDKVEGITLDPAFPTRGPMNRFKHVLFVEKQGFDHQLKTWGVEERYDVSLMSTKGMSVTAARELIEEMSLAGVKTLVLHDFDKSGLGILHWLYTSNNRYRFKCEPLVHDIGLRLADVERLGLRGEQVVYKKTKKDPREQLRVYGATEAECNYLVSAVIGPRSWGGRRVELNELVGNMLFDFIELKFAEFGVKKVVPDVDTLAVAYRRATRINYLQDVLNKAVEEVNAREIETPADISVRVSEVFIREPMLSWDFAVSRIAREDTAVSDAAAGGDE
jgi:hypothetical protein